MKADLSIFVITAISAERKMIHPKHKDWLDQRGSLSDIADAMEVQTVERHGKAWLCFPYRLGGEVVNRKYRLTSDKRHEMDKGGTLCLWNAECLSDDPQEVIITEGEFDALAAMRCGYHAVVSVPNGAPAEAVDDPVNSNRYAFLWKSENELKRVKSFVLATDADKPGRILAKDLAAILGPERCKFVEYPEGCKDLNEVLLKHGQEAVTSLIVKAKPYPVVGLYKLSDFPADVEVQSMSTGLSELDELMRIALGTLTIFTGYSNMGKSTVINTIVGHALGRGVPVCIASFETIPRPILERSLIGAVQGGGDYSPAEASEIVHGRLSVITNAQDDDAEIDLDYYLELLRVAVIRDGCRIIVLDPWNELEHKRRRDETETDYIGRAIRQLKAFAKRHNVALWVVAHPTKPMKGTNAMPSLYDISGCHSADTEVLTKRGWLTHDQLTKEDEVACFDLDDSSLTYQRPSRIICKPFDGDLYRFKGYGFDQCVTPDHRMVVKPQWSDPVGTQSDSGIGRPTRWEKGKWAFCEAKDLPSAPFNLPLAAPLKDAPGDGVSPLLAKLAGWFVSEGSWQSSGVSLAQAADTEGARKIEALLTALEVPFTVSRSAPGGKGGKLPGNSYYIGVRGAREVVVWLRENCGKGSANKRVPEAIMEGPEKVKRAFLSAYLDGDGHLRANGTYSAATTSPTLRDQLQRLAVELGFSCCWHERKPQNAHHAPSWMLSFGREDRRETAVRKYRSVTREAYSGHVWCLTVPTGAYVTRRNGKASISGNSANWANKADYGLVYHRPDKTKNEGQLAVVKVRMGLPGRCGSFGVRLNNQTGRIEADPLAAV